MQRVHFISRLLFLRREWVEETVEDLLFKENLVSAV